jgi:hypothetical protein
MTMTASFNSIVQLEANRERLWWAMDKGAIEAAPIGRHGADVAGAALTPPLDPAFFFPCAARHPVRYRSLDPRWPRRPVCTNTADVSPDWIWRVRNSGQADALVIRRVPVAAAP